MIARIPDIYLTVECNTCGAIYRAYRIINPTEPQIMYCMFCGVPHPLVSQDNERDYLECLARRYDKTIEQIDGALKLWEAMPPKLKAQVTFRQLIGVK